MHRKTYQLGGLLLLAAALLAIVGGLLHGAQPATLEAFGAIDHGRWRLSHLALAGAGALFTMTALFLARRFAGSAGEGWALAGAGSLLLGGVSIFAVGALEITGFFALHDAGGVAAEHAFGAASAVMASLAAAAAFLFPVALAAFGLAMRDDADWPGWLAWAGIALGVVLLLVRAFGVSLPGGAELVPFYAGNAWFAVAGLLFYRMGGKVEAPRAAAGAPHGSL